MREDLSSCSELLYAKCAPCQDASFRPGCVCVGVFNMNGSMRRKVRGFGNAGDGITLTGRGVYTQRLGVYTRG